MKNLIIGYGETLTKKAEVPSGPHDKKHPYTLEETKVRISEKLSKIIDLIEEKPEQECVDGEVVIKFIQHPSYLAKSYYPRKLFDLYGLQDVGSKAVKIKPEKWAIKNPPDEGLSSCIYVSGTKKQYKDMLNHIKGEDSDEQSLSYLRTIETIENFNGVEKIKRISDIDGKLKLEIVLHARKDDHNVLLSFINYIESLGGTCDTKYMKNVGGLTFIPAILDLGMESKLADFSHLRVLRSLPPLRINNPEMLREQMSASVSLPKEAALNSEIKVCIFDGGLADSHLLTQWAKEIIPEGVTSGHPQFLSHGGEVCSTYLFGPYDTEIGTLGKPYTNVDVVRVLSPNESDPDLFEVLSRIERVLEEREYKYVNLSLGPRLAIDDDEVHVWTSVLDSLLQDGSCLATVAVGNDGDLKGDNARIQPPSDMVNSFSIGSSNTDGDIWEKASYSCIGPGRSPGLIKPDGVMFGGDHNNLFYVYSPSSHSIVGTMGTSYAAPYALRVAAGIDAITDIDLTPLTVKALMIHSANKTNNHDVKHVGWGRLPSTPEEVVECQDDEATIIYQGQLHQSQYIRVPIPLPKNIDCTWVHLEATFCINTATDPEHPLHYTRGGLDITFRPHSQKIKRGASNPDSKPFFTNNNLYPTEEDLRSDAAKWETCISRNQKYRKNTLFEPEFFVKYHAREQGGNASRNLEPLSYSLIVTIRAEGDTSIYNSILQQNQTLQAIRVRNRIEV